MPARMTVSGRYEKALPSASPAPQCACSPDSCRLTTAATPAAAIAASRPPFRPRSVGRAIATTSGPTQLECSPGRASGGGHSAGSSRRQ